MSADRAMLGTSGYARRERDAYPTPLWVTEALINSQVEFRGDIWEPAAGAGDMASILRWFYRVVATDIGWADSTDFLQQQSLPDGVKSIVTNPPFDRIDAFIRHALELTRPPRGMVAMLGRHELDCAAGRRDPPFAVKIVLTRRPRWVARHPGDSSPRHNFSWFVWDWEHAGPSVLRYAP